LRSFIGVSWSVLKIAGCDDEYPTRFSAAWGDHRQLFFSALGACTAPIFLMLVFPWWRNSTSWSGELVRITSKSIYLFELGWHFGVESVQMRIGGRSQCEADGL
jgi:hypothetical protein